MFENLKIIGQAHFIFYKRIRKARSTTPKYKVFGELLRFHLETKLKLDGFILGSQQKCRKYFVYQCVT
jgi:hypothetical protein